MWILHQSFEVQLFWCAFGIYWLYIFKSKRISAKAALWNYLVMFIILVLTEK